MQRKTLILLTASVLALGSTAFFADAVPASGNSDNRAMQADGAPVQRLAHHRDGQRGLHAPPAVRASVRDMIAIERLYREGGKSRDVPDFYRGILAKTQNPLLRNFAYRRLARLEAAPTNTDAAIATLRQSLDENLKLAERKPEPR